MNYINDDYDSNKPEEHLDGEDLEWGMDAPQPEDDFICTSCGSHSCKSYMIDGDDHRMHTEMVCDDCGATYTD